VKNIVFLLVLFTCNSTINFGQFTFGIKLGGIGFHPKKDGNEKLYKYKVNKSGSLALFKGISLCFAYNINDYIGIKAVQTILFGDCTNNFAGISYIGINFNDRIVNWKNNKHRGSLSFAPLFYCRKNWNKIEGYTTNSNFIKISKNKMWETKFVLYGGQIQYDFYFSEDNAASINLLPGHP